MARDKTIVRQQAPSLVGQPQVDFRKNDFEALIEQKGYRVYKESSVSCPCADNKNGNHPLSSCKNCGGSGYVFINKTETRMVITSMNVNNQYKEWSEERIGTAAITARDVDKLSHMDKITLADGMSEFSELLHPQIIEINTFNKLIGFTFYDIEDIEAIFLFDGGSNKLKLLTNITDYTYQYNRIVLDDQYNSLNNPTLSVRYKHRPQFLVIDIPRDIMNSPVLNKVTGQVEDLTFPIHAIARRAHYVLDQENYAGNRVFDNSFNDTCDTINQLTKFQKLVKNSEISVIFDTLTDTQKEELFKLLFIEDEFSVITAQNSIYVS